MNHYDWYFCSKLIKMLGKDHWSTAQTYDGLPIIVLSCSSNASFDCCVAVFKASTGRKVLAFSLKVSIDSFLSKGANITFPCASIFYLYSFAPERITSFFSLSANWSKYWSLGCYFVIFSLC